MIVTLLITILVEGIVVIGYSVWQEKPVYPILLTSICGNLITQSLLWIVLNLFFRDYILTLLIVEVLIWIMESVLLYSVPANRLRFANAVLLSLGMNLFSFSVGWFLSV